MNGLHGLQITELYYHLLRYVLEEKLKLQASRKRETIIKDVSFDKNTTEQRQDLSQEQR